MSKKARKKKPARSGAIKRLSPVEKEASTSVLEITREQSFSGPIPPPEVLLRYDQHLPGLADRIVTMAEKESEHRRKMEQQMLTGDISLKGQAYSERKRGQVFGFILAFAAIGGGVLLAMSGIPGWGTLLGLSGVAALAGVFVLGRRVDKDS